jgi:PAS domain S-box-containing protein
VRELRWLREWSKGSTAAFVFGCVALALLTLLGELFDAQHGAAALLYLTAVVVTSLWGRVVPALLVLILAILGLTYLFPSEFWTFQILGGTTDVVALITFMAVAFLVTQLIGRVRAGEAQWRDVFENNPTMYFIVDADGTVVAVNAFGAEQLGYTVDELIGTPVLSVFPESERPAIQEHFATSLEHVGQGYSWEAHKVRKDGTLITVRETAKAVPRAKGPIVLIACEDVTERRRAAEALRQAQADLAHVSRVVTMGELTSSIAHEVNQPLAGIVTNASACLRWLAGDTPNLQEAREAAQRIIRDGNRASEVVTRIRALATKADTEKQPLDLNDAVQEVLTLTQAEMRRNAVILRGELASDLPQVLGDRVQLQQVVLNLVMNGIEAMSTVRDRPRVLTISTQRGEGDQVRVTVQDSGAGLDSKSEENIFKAFYTTKRGGMGMGLSISRTIVENHGGRLSTVPGNGPGATFQFTVPQHA